MATNSTNTKASKPEVTETEAPKAKRRMPTQAEKIAALEAKLAETKAKGEAKQAKLVEKLKADREALVSKRIDLDVKIDAIDKELVALGAGPVVDTDIVGDSVDNS